MNGNLFVFRPGVAPVPGENVFNDWALLISAMSGVEGRKMLEFDDSVETPCKIPAGTWPMKDVMWAGFGPRPGVPRTTVHILSGAVFTNLRMIGGQITIVNQAQNSASSPVSDFATPDQVEIGLRDDCGTAQLVNQCEVPMFDVGANLVSFFIQNCIFGMPTSDVPKPTPLIQQSRGSVLTLNLIGQNQTGPKVVSSAQGASVLFGALSSSAQVAVDQTSITDTGGTYRFGPQGRIQRLVIPRPSAPPATSSQPFNTPNVLIRCDGTPPGFTQVLPGIKSGFVIGNTTVNLYTGGQEVVVAEVAGGSGLKVRPTSGDTIDGGAEVHIHKHGSRTLVSDGESNWITISKVD